MSEISFNVSDKPSIFVLKKILVLFYFFSDCGTFDTIKKFK